MKAPILVNFEQPPEEAMAYLENKGFELDFDRTKVIKDAHHKAFTVAKVARLDLLYDLYAALIHAQEEGLSFKAFKESLSDTLETKGWKKGLEAEKETPWNRNLSEAERSARRLKRIFQTNMNVAYNVGRYRQMRQLKSSVYWYYASARLNTTRESHYERHGTVKHRDDEWWTLNYPPNGWGCHCKVRAYSKRELERKGLKVHEEKLPDVAEGEWAYDVGAGSRVGKLKELYWHPSLEKMPVTQKDEGLSEKEVNRLGDKESEELDQKLSEAFFEGMGIKKGDMWIDPIGDPMIIDEELFRDKNRNTLKITKGGRHLYLSEIIRTLKDPDEIILELQEINDTSKIEPFPPPIDGNPPTRLVKKLFRYVYDEKKKKLGAVMVVFAYHKDKTQGATAYYTTTSKIEEKRRGTVAYQKEVE